jgi:hypothetical protein
MKTIRNSKTGEIKRLHDEGAEKLISNTYLGWNYVPKSEWKKDKSSVVVEMPKERKRKENDEMIKVSSKGKKGNKKPNKR